MIDFLSEVVLDALKDSAIVLPFVFIIYVIMELIENARNKEKLEHALQGKFAPIIAATTGIIPECGFSVVCAKLFDSGLITIGTLIAAFIATSDEGLVVLLTNGKGIPALVVIAFKIVFGFLFGILFNTFLKRLNNNHVCPEKDDCIECGEKHKGVLDKFILHPLFHSLKVLAYIFIVNVLFGALFHYVGEDKIDAFLESNILIQPVISSLIGLIPNCASSTIIAQSYVAGGISFGALVAGLSSNAGVGILILFKNKKSLIKNLIILAILFLLGIVIGYLGLLINL